MPGDPELVIPVRLDSAPAEHGLEKLGAAGTKAGTAVKHGADEAAKGVKGAAQEALSMASALGAVSVAGVGLSQVKQIVGGMLDHMKDVSDNAHRMAKDFLQTQQAMQGIAAISGKGNTNKFTLDEVRKGASANLTPQEWTGFRDAFLAKSSNYVGDGASSRLNDADSDDFQRSLAEYAKLHHVGTADMASFGGALLAGEQGPTTAAKMKAKAGAVFKTLEASSAEVSHLLPGMTEQMAAGLSAEQAAPLLAQMPEIAPNQESTYLRRTISELRQKTIEGKIGEEYGVKKGMGAQEMLSAVVGNLEDRSKRGEDLGEAILGITHEEVSGATLRGLAGKGRSGLKQWQNILAETSPNAIDEDIAAGRKTESGKFMHGQSQLALAEAERGAKRAPVELLRTEAQAQLTKEGRLDETHVEDFFRKPLTMFGPKINDQLINERALAMAYDEVRVPQNKRDTLAPGALQQVADEKILAVLERQNRLLERQTQLAEEAARPKDKPGPPLVGVPGGNNNGSGRMGGG